MKQTLVTAILYTLATTLILGILYPALLLGLAQFMPDLANGQLLSRNGVVVGSRLIGQSFSGKGYFHPRPSATGVVPYDATNSTGSNLGPTNQKLVDRVTADVKALSEENPGRPVPIDLVTASASGLDPDISPASALFQVKRVARARGIGDGELEAFVELHTTPRQLGFLGEPRVNVLELNLALDERWPSRPAR